MVDYGQLLAAAQTRLAPQQERVQAQSETAQTGYEVKREKKIQQEEAEALMQKELKKASEGSGLFSGLGKLSSLLGFWMPGLSTAFGTIAGAGQAYEQKSAIEDLMSSGKFDHLKNTWLADPTKKYMEKLKGLAGDIDPMKTGLTSLATSLATSKMMGSVKDKGLEMFKGKTVAPDKLVETTKEILPTGTEYIDKVSGESVFEPSFEDSTFEFTTETIPGETTEGFYEGAGGPMKNLLANIKAGRHKDIDLLGTMGDSLTESQTSGIQAMPYLYDLIAQER